MFLRAITDACRPAEDVRVLIQVFGASTLTLDAGSNDNQTVCNNTALPPISYTVGNSLDANVVGLPDGLVGNFVAPNNFIISGNVNVPGLTETTSYTYTITTANNPGGPLVGPCGTSSITGVITVRPEESLTLRPANGAVTQQVCYGEDLTPIVIDVVGDNTFASAVVPANIPNGVNFNFVEDADNMGGVLTISGSPSDAIVGNNAVTYSFVVTTDGPNTSPCAGVTQQIDIEVVPASTLVYAGADPSVPNQTVCSGTPLTDIEFRIGGGARDVNVSGTLFTAGGFTRAGNVVVNDPSNPQNSEIYGVAPVVASTTTFTYEITTINQCNPGTNEISYAGVITVLPEESLTVRPANGAVTQQVCYGEDLTPIVIDVVGDNTFASAVVPANIPNGVNFNFVEDADNMGGVLTISGSPSDAIVGNNAVTYSFVVTTDGPNTSPCAGYTQQIDIEVVPASTLSVRRCRSFSS